MRLGWFDRYFRDEDEDEEVEPYEEARPAPMPDLEPPILAQQPGARYGVVDEPFSSAPTPPASVTVSAPLPTPPQTAAPPAPTAEATPAAVRAVAQWAGNEVVGLLADLSPSARERVAEALLLWHDTEGQLLQSLVRARATIEQTDRLLHGSLADPEFAADAEKLRQGNTQQESALATLVARNQTRAREWVLSAVQGQRQWPPAKVLRLFEKTGVGPLTLADLQSRLRSMDGGPRAWAAEALGEMPAPEAGASLLNLLRDPDAEVRATAVAALGRKADPALLHALGTVIKRDPDWAVRRRAIAAAQAVEGYEAIGFLHQLLKDAAWWRELQVLDAMDRPDPSRPTPPVDAPRENYQKVRAGVVDALLAKVQAALPAADPPHRAWLMEVLGDTADPRAVPLLSSALQDVELDVRLRAIRGLGHIGGPSIVDLITPSLKDQQSHVRIQAAEALGDTNEFRALDPLLESLKDSSEFVRAAVTVAIGKILDTRALKPMLDALNDPDKETRDHMQSAMQRMSDPRTMRLVMGMLEAGGLKRPPGG